MVGRLVKAGLVRKTNIRLSEFPRHVVNKSFTLYLELEVVVVDNYSEYPECSCNILRSITLVLRGLPTGKSYYLGVSDKSVVRGFFVPHIFIVSHDGPWSS
jgi:hypothetical protein